MRRSCKASRIGGKTARSCCVRRMRQCRRRNCRWTRSLMRTLLSLAKSLGVERFCVEQVEDRMKRMGMFSLTFGIVIGFALAAAFAVEPSEAELMKQAKITKAEAERVALAKVSQGIVKS